MNYSRFCIGVSIVLSLFNVALSQTQQLYYSGPKPQSMFQASEIFRNGIDIEIIGMDAVSQMLDLRSYEIENVADQGAKSAGWSVNKASGVAISVAVTPLAQDEEDLFSFRIQVTAGPTSLKAGTEEFTNIDGNITAQKKIKIPQNDKTLILTTTQEMVRSVAQKLRLTILKQRLGRPDINLEPHDDHPLN